MDIGQNIIKKCRKLFWSGPGTLIWIYYWHHWPSSPHFLPAKHGHTARVSALLRGMAFLNVVPNRFTKCGWFSPGFGPFHPSHASTSVGARRSTESRLVLVAVYLVCNVCKSNQWMQGRRQRGARRSTAVASSRIELLVDGDSFSIDMVRSAMNSLEDARHQVHTTLFAQPERLQNKTWAKFISEPHVSFQAVHRRSVELGREPNDEAIVNTMRKLSLLSYVNTVALLTGDSDFVGHILELQNSGNNVIVLLEGYKLGTISSYRRAGVKVVPLRLSQHRHRPSTVSAVLFPNGTGSVQLGLGFQNPPYDTFLAREHSVVKFMTDLGYRQDEGGFLHHQCAKFWYENGLGPLTVFPNKASVTEVHDFVSQWTGRKAWERNNVKLAYFLPFIKPTGRISSHHLKTYGSGIAKAVFEGGGPFMLEDSPDLPSQALKRLGFLDDGLNADLSEAMFVFANVANNKKSLRKLGMLPDPDDNYLDYYKRLHSAFLSTASAGQWQVLKKQASAMQTVVLTLQKANALPQKTDLKYSTEDVFEAMKEYAKKCQLPRMQTFNGLRYRILRHIERKDPSMRREVGFDRRQRSQKWCFLWAAGWLGVVNSPSASGYQPKEVNQILFVCSCFSFLKVHEISTDWI